MCKYEDLENFYRRLKNKIKQTKLDDSLYVIWKYISHLNDRDVLFDDVEISSDFLNRDGIQKRRMLAEWDLQILLREVIIHSQEHAYRPKTFRKAKYFADTVNIIKDEITECISKDFIRPLNPADIKLEINRISHRQFPWQIKNPTQIYLTRYYKIFNQEDVRQIVENKLGLSLRKFYLITLVLYGFYLDKIGIDYPPKIDIPELSLEEIEKVLSFISISLEDIRKKYIEVHKIDENFLYMLNQNEIYPIIRMEYMGVDRLVCTDATILFWRVTDGLYYELYKETDFDHKFGNSFETYIGEVIEKTKQEDLEYTREYEYGSRHNKRKTSDWIISKNDEVMFIECKTKRMRKDSKVNIIDTSSLEADLDKMSDFVIQTYKKIRDYKNGDLDRHKPFDKDKIFPLIVTLENWHILGPVYEEIEEMVIKKIEEENIPQDYLEKYPFSICSTDTFETLMQVIQKNNISTVMESVLRPERKDWEFISALKEEFGKDIENSKFLFEDDFDEILPERFK